MENICNECKAAIGGRRHALRGDDIIVLIIWLEKWAELVKQLRQNRLTTQ